MKKRITGISEGTLSESGAKDSGDPLPKAGGAGGGSPPGAANATDTAGTLDAGHQAGSELETATAGLLAKVSALESQMEAAGHVLEELTKERDEWAARTKAAVEQYHRAKDDLDSYRRRTERDLENRVTREKADFIATLLGVVDNFDRALEMPAVGSAEGFMKGMAMIRRGLLDALQKEGVEAIPSPVGAHMDPNLHEAVLAQEGGGDHGVVLEELLKGYVYKGMVLRATQVKVIR